jgi:hypothetical protein
MSYADIHINLCGKHPELNGARNKRGACVGCNRERSAAHYRANRENEIKKAMAWQAANREKTRSYTKKYKDRYRQEHPLYSVWQNMKSRCQRPSATMYHRYGGRGISVCESWQEFKNFEAWGLKSGYAPDLEIDRINNDGNYEPGNCRWVVKVVNTRNSTSAKLQEDDVGLIRSLLIAGMRQRDVAAQFSIGKSLIGYIAQGKLWRDVAPSVAY